MKIEIDGMIAVPLRAVKFFTHGLIDDFSLAQCLAGFGPFAEDYPVLRPFRQTPADLEELPRGMFLRFYQEAEDANRRGDSVALRAAVPAGVLVWLEDTKHLHESIEIDLAMQASADGRIQLAGGWNENPLMTSEDLTYVQEGATGQPALRRGRTSKLENGRDPKLQVRARAVSRELQADGKPATRRAVAAVLAKEIGLAVSTCERRILMDW